MSEWGVMFQDGSVRHPWNGRTERQRAEDDTRRLQERYAPDDICLARWVDSKWWPYIGPLPAPRPCWGCGMTGTHKMDCSLR